MSKLVPVCISRRRDAAPARGFTLIEAMVTVGIVAILGGIAVPAYMDYTRRGQVSEASAFLSDYRTKMEQFYQDNRNYGTGGACAQAGAATPSWAGFPASKYFVFNCRLTDSGQGYLLTATGSSGRAVGHIYVMDNTVAGSNNPRRTTQFKNTSSTANCWLIKGDEC